MEIGEEEKAVIVEPIEDPFHPTEAPEETPVPVEPEKVPVPV